MYTAYFLRKTRVEFVFASTLSILLIGDCIEHSLLTVQKKGLIAVTFAFIVCRSLGLRSDDVLARRCCYSASGLSMLYLL